MAEDASLDDLMAALQDAQVVKATARLSERNIVELINKIQELGLLENKLLHSIHGRDYITQEQLCREVQQQVQAAGGRLAVSDLPAQLGVDLAYCQQQAEVAVRESDGQMQVVQGELMTEHYFDGVAAETEESLQEAGMVTLVDLARRFKLGSDTMQQVIQSRLGSEIHGQFESGLLTTSAHYSRIKSQVRGALRAATLPVNTTALIKGLQLSSIPSISRTVQAAIEELIEEKAIFGSFKAGTFVPLLYAKNQQQAAQNFYQQNSFIEYSMLDRLGIADRKAYIAKTFPDALNLDSVAVAPQLEAQLEAAVEEALGSGGWTDTMSHMPSALNASDTSMLLDRLMGHIGNGSASELLAGTCILSSEFLEHLRQKCLNLAREAAQVTLEARKTSAAPAISSNTESAAKGGAAKPGVGPVQQGDSDDDWDTGKGGSKKKKGARRKAPAKGKSNAPAVQSNPKNSSLQQGKDAGISLLTVASMASRMEEWAPETSGCGEAGNLPEVLAERLRAETTAEYVKTLAAIFSAGAEARRRKRDTTAKAVEVVNQRFRLYAHGLELVQQDEPTHTALEKHLLRTAGQELLDLILRFQEIDLKKGEGEEAIPDSETKEKDQLRLQPLTASERSQLLKALPSDAAPSARAAQDALSSASCQEAQERLTDAASAAGIQLRNLDKKAEKAMVQDFRVRLQEELKQAESPADILALAVPVLAVKIHGRAMSIPGKALAGVISFLKANLEGDSADKLERFHSLVVDSLRNQSDQPNEQLLQLQADILQMCGPGQLASTIEKASAE